jgi:hypothetical protein
MYSCSQDGILNMKRESSRCYPWFGRPWVIWLLPTPPDLLPPFLPSSLPPSLPRCALVSDDGHRTFAGVNFTWLLPVLHVTIKPTMQCTARVSSVELLQQSFIPSCLWNIPEAVSSLGSLLVGMLSHYRLHTGRKDSVCVGGGGYELSLWSLGLNPHMP